MTGTEEVLNGTVSETVVYAYDNNGNQLSQTSTAYIAGVAQTPVVEQANTYDLFNQLIETVTSTGAIVLSTYNGDGLRVGKSVNGAVTRYLYEYQKVVLEENAAGDQTGRNVYGINLITRQVEGDTLTYMYNGHADVTALLDTAGNVVATYYYDAFGNILSQTGTVNNNILYAGYQYDKETGLYYLNARMYDPVTARFMQEDTYTGEYNDPLSLNLYTYCHNEPLRYSDPTGHNTLDDYAYQKQEPYHPADGYSQNSSSRDKDQQKKKAAVKSDGYNQDIQYRKDNASTNGLSEVTKSNTAYKSTSSIDIKSAISSQVSLYAISGSTDAALAYLQDVLNERGGTIDLSLVYNSDASEEDKLIQFALLKLSGIQGSTAPEDYYLGLSQKMVSAGGPYIEPGEIMNFDQTTMDGITKVVQVRTEALQTNPLAKFTEDNNTVLQMLSDHIGYAATLALGFNMYNEQVAVEKAAQEKAGQAAAKEAAAKEAANAAVQTETFYRTMSKADYEMLLKTGKVPATPETFISPTQSYSELYNGVTVEIKVRAGTTDEIANIGVRDTSTVTKGAYEDMPIVDKGWNTNGAYFKGEGEQINIGLGKGQGLNIFNNNIVDFQVVRGG